VSFREAKSDNFYGVFLNEDHFAEWVTYYPKKGPSREILVKIQSPGQQEQRPTRNEVSEYEDEQLHVTLGKDEGHEKGGVERPAIGDAFVREGEEHLDRFVFEGDVVRSTPMSWTLKFSRAKQRSFGTAHRRS